MEEESLRVARKSSFPFSFGPTQRHGEPLHPASLSWSWICDCQLHRGGGQDSVKWHDDPRGSTPPHRR